MNTTPLNYQYDDQVITPLESNNDQIWNDEEFMPNHDQEPILPSFNLMISSPFLHISPSPDTNLPEDSKNSLENNSQLDSLASNINTEQIFSNTHSPNPDASYEESSKESSKAESKKSKLRKKAEQHKDRNPPKTKAIKKDKELDKRTKQLIRNRISAQRSRDRKREELETAKEQNDLLRKEIEEKTQKLSEISREFEETKQAIERMNHEAQEEFYRQKALVSSNSQQNTRRSFGRINPKIALIGTFLGCLCIIGCLTPFMGNTNNANNIIPQPVMKRGRLMLANEQDNYNYGNEYTNACTERLMYFYN